MNPTPCKHFSVTPSLKWKNKKTLNTKLKPIWGRHGLYMIGDSRSVPERSQRFGFRCAQCRREAKGSGFAALSAGEEPKVRVSLRSVPERSQRFGFRCAVPERSQRFGFRCGRDQTGQQSSPPSPGRPEWLTKLLKKSLLQSLSALRLQPPGQSHPVALACSSVL